LSVSRERIHNSNLFDTKICILKITLDSFGRKSSPSQKRACSALEGMK
jgi:hypothetical protein